MILPTFYENQTDCIMHTSIIIIILPVECSLLMPSCGTQGSLVLYIRGWHNQAQTQGQAGSTVPWLFVLTVWQTFHVLEYLQWYQWCKKRLKTLTLLWASLRYILKEFLKRPLACGIVAYYVGALQKLLMSDMLCVFSLFASCMSASAKKAWMAIPSYHPTIFPAESEPQQLFQTLLFFPSWCRCKHRQTLKMLREVRGVVEVSVAQPDRDSWYQAWWRLA